MQRSFIEKGVVLTYKLPSHTLWARNGFHDHADFNWRIVFTRKWSWSGKICMVYWSLITSIEPSKDKKNYINLSRVLILHKGTDYESDSVATFIFYNLVLKMSTQISNNFTLATNKLIQYFKRKLLAKFEWKRTTKWDCVKTTNEQRGSISVMTPHGNRRQSVSTYFLH